MTTPAILLVAALVAVFIMGWMLSQRIATLETARQETMPIVVVDLAQVANHYPEGASAETVESLMQQANQAILSLRQSGYVVLDAQAVLSAPEDRFLPAEYLLPESEEGEAAGTGEAP